ncbi:hypothetical protein BDP27DRAFT_1318363 [Rhodocollybia butyracea]|uniref:Uncharacterized protein n=1 Tax=Rhodocollybia butyracea TaxID=206335 RepID=A0A9P5Q4L2_9AGAR|nr:hypothetical protein BDP27DRAFT_1318363 [Rhodocollybia butyracea]
MRGTSPGYLHIFIKFISSQILAFPIYSPPTFPILIVDMLVDSKHYRRTRSQVFASIKAWTNGTMVNG